MYRSAFAGVHLPGARTLATSASTGPRKRRTREHVIADLSVNHVERFVLRCGWTTERTRHDYGLDLEMKTYNAAGETESEHVLLQLKATDRPACARPWPSRCRAA
jgi:hypothetical protein